MIYTHNAPKSIKLKKSLPGPHAVRGEIIVKYLYIFCISDILTKKSSRHKNENYKKKPVYFVDYCRVFLLIFTGIKKGVRNAGHIL